MVGARGWEGGMNGELLFGEHRGSLMPCPVRTTPKSNPYFDFYHFRLFGPDFKLPINGITEYILFGISLLSLNMSVRVSHIVECVSSSFFLIIM